MKLRFALIGIVFFAANASAHYFGPVNQTNSIDMDGYSQIEMYIDTKESGDFVFRVGNKVIADKKGIPYKKYVFGGERATFPMTINNKFIQQHDNGQKYVPICAMQVIPNVQFQPEVCFNVHVE